MDSIVRAAFVYFFILLIFRISPKRALDQLAPHEFVLILMLGGIAVPAMQADDRSLTNAVLLMCTLMGLHLIMQWLRQRSPVVSKVLSGTPLLVREDGHMHDDRMKKLLVNSQDIMAAVRARGLEHIEDAKWIVVERNGQLQVIPKG